MRINHNISAMITQGSLFQANRATAKSLARLSTGLRINGAADDAAGLGVSENLRTQVRGLSQAMRNTQDAIALLNIADGALQEQTEILQRMRELVIQAKNETYTSIERNYMFTEFKGLMAEIDRIAASTTYNGMRIFAAPEMESGAEGQTMYASGAATQTPHVLRDGRLAWDAPARQGSTFGTRDYSSAKHFNMQIGANYNTTDQAAFNSAVYSFDPAAANVITIQLGQMDSNAILAKDPSLGGAAGMGNASAVFDNWNWNSAVVAGGDIQDRLLSIAYYGAPGQGTYQTKLDYLLALIDNKDDAIPVVAQLRSNDPLNAGLRTANVTGLDRINQMRASIGAMVNRLEHAVNNDLNQIAATQSAESVIRDADFAAESTTFTRNNILTQSATAMLAQANVRSQAVLGLLR